MKRPSPFWLSISVVCIILGFLVSLQFRSNTTKSDIPLRRTQELTLELYNARLERDKLTEEIVALRTKTGDSGSELQKAQQAAGMVAVTGPGIVLTLENASQDSNLYLITYEDLLFLVNECWAAGAEAVSLNENRLITMSGIIQGENAIMVNKVAIKPPYVIKAIGNPEVIETSLIIKGGLLETMKNWGVKTSLTKNAQIDIPAYSRAVRFTHGKLGK